MSALQALLFGITQGLCEFFPVSSSAHLKFLKLFFNLGINESSFLSFELACNAGTTLAAIFFLRKKIVPIFTQERKTLFFIFLAILPLIPIFFFFKPIIALASYKSMLGFFFIFSSTLLFITAMGKEKKKSNSSLKGKIKDVLFIGLMQALALIPGISRSGSTISAGCMRGWDIRDAIGFSFILAIPTIMGGNVLESLRLYKGDQVLEISLMNYLIGFVASFIFGLLTIRYIFSITSKRALLPFAWYCLTIGAISLIYFNLF